MKEWRIALWSISFRWSVSGSAHGGLQFLKFQQKVDVVFCTLITVYLVLGKSEPHTGFSLVQMDLKKYFDLFSVFFCRKVASVSFGGKKNVKLQFNSLTTALPYFMMLDTKSALEQFVFVSFLTLHDGTFVVYQLRSANYPNKLLKKKKEKHTSNKS